MPKRATSTSFKPGQSGNPGGVSKVSRHVKELARQHTAEAIEALVAALKCKGERVPAAQALLDRGWGKPAQPIAGEDGAPLAVSGITVTFVGSPAIGSEAQSPRLERDTPRLPSAAPDE
jgi:hypothetical protein